MTEARMQEAPENKPGTFCWVELGTTSSETAKSFYAQLFGWEYVDSPMGPDMVYSMVKLNGKDVGGLYQLSQDMLAQQIPPHWLSYVSVANADEAVEKAKAEGATVLNGPFDVATAGRMAVVQDPTSAVFAVWEARQNPGVGVYGAPGALVWNELGTNDTQKAGTFYSNLFSWDLEPFQGALPYTIFKNGDRGVGGMYQITPEMGPLPPHWLVYFAVENCDATVQKATDLGGSVMKPAEDIPQVGRFAILRDPASAVFAVLKPEPRQA